MDLEKLLQLNYWFGRMTMPFSQKFFWMVFVVFALAIVLGFIFLYLKNKNQLDKIMTTVWLKLEHLLFSFGFIGLVLMFFRQQRSPYLSMRALLFLWLIACLVWLGFILKHLFVKVPKLKEAKKKQAELKKYIP